MKKTKLLIVIALAVLATLAMSACGLIVNSVSDIEFVKMPKTYYSTTDIETNGITIKLNVTSSSTLVPETVSCTIKADGEIYNKDNIVLNATGFSTEMGEHEIVVKDANGAVEISAQYRVCKEIADEATLRSSLLTVAEGETDTGYFMLKDDIENDDGFFVVKRPFVLYGEGHSIIKTGYNNTDTTSESYEKDGYNVSTATKFFQISKSYLPEKYQKDSLYEFNNVTMYVKEGVQWTTVNRGVNIYGLIDCTVNFNACGISGVDHYPINVGEDTVITLNIANGTWSNGYCGINFWAHNSIVNIDTATLAGVNTYTGKSSDFATIAVYNSNNVFNIVNTDIIIISNTAVENGSKQAFINLKDTAANNVLNFVNCMYSTQLNDKGEAINFNRLDNLNDTVIWDDGSSNVISVK